MAINARAYSTLQYEVGAIADSATTLTPGMAVKVSKIPVSPVTKVTDQYFNIGAARAGDEVVGVISLGGNVTDSTAGRMVTLNAGFFPVLLGASLMKGDPLKPTTGGKWIKAGTGDQAYAELMEDGTTDTVVWAKPRIAKI